MRGSEDITLAKAVRRSAALTANTGGVTSLAVLQTSRGQASASFGVVRRTRVSNSTGPRSAAPKVDQMRSGPTRKKAAAKKPRSSGATTKRLRRVIQAGLIVI